MRRHLAGFFNVALFGHRRLCTPDNRIRGRAGAVSYPFLSVALPGDLICVSFSASSTTRAKTSTLKSTVRRDTVLRSWHQDRIALNLRSRLCCRYFEDSSLSPQEGIKLTWPSHSNSWPAETAENKCSLSKDATHLGLLLCLTNAR